MFWNIFLFISISCIGDKRSRFELGCLGPSVSILVLCRYIVNVLWNKFSPNIYDNIEVILKVNKYDAESIAFFFEIVVSVVEVGSFVRWIIAAIINKTSHMHVTFPLQVKLSLMNALQVLAVAISQGISTLNCWILPYHLSIVFNNVKYIYPLTLFY